MSEIRYTYTVTPSTPPIYTTREQVWAAAGDAYRAWRRNGESEDSAAKSASEFYQYQMGELHERMAIETVCAWCDAHLSGVVGAPEGHISHGICPTCLAREFPETVPA